MTNLVKFTWKVVSLKKLACLMKFPPISRILSYLKPALRNAVISMIKLCHKNNYFRCGIFICDKPYIFVI